MPSTTFKHSSVILMCLSYKPADTPTERMKKKSKMFSGVPMTVELVIRCMSTLLVQLRGGLCFGSNQVDMPYVLLNVYRKMFIESNNLLFHFLLIYSIFYQSLHTYIWNKHYNMESNRINNTLRKHTSHSAHEWSVEHTKKKKNIGWDA